MKEPAFSSAVRLMEDALALAKRMDAGAWAIYLCGIVPFFSLLLFALTDVVQNPFAFDHLVTFGFVLAVLFYWMHICQSVFCALLYAVLTESSLDIRNSWIAAFRSQTPVAGAKLFAWPAALVLLVPFSFVTSFFQHSLLAPDAGRSGQWRKTLMTARADAYYRPMVALWFVAIVFLLRTILWVNLLTLLFVLPQLWKVFTGLEGNITRAPQVLFNPTSIAALSILAYIGLDPIVKAAFVLRRFARVSEKSGDDLRLRLAWVRKNMAAAILLALVFIAPDRAKAQQPPAQPRQATVTPDQMQHAIHSVFRDPANVWNLPAVQHKNQKKDAFTAFMDSVANTIDRIWDAILTSISNAMEWLRHVFSNADQSAKEKSKPVSTRDATVVLACFAALLLGGMVFAALQRRRQPKIQLTAAVNTIANKIDLSNDDADPLDQPVKEWRSLAQQYRASGEFRLALRALYLETLATLAEHKLVSPARGKTNADYARELQRRGKRFGAEFVSVFLANTEIFERSWYGDHPANDQLVDTFDRNVTALRKQLS
ncbi:MAG: DUF4129 domain-containing protein [Acidobacteriaceae bacterium]|nr:DUF4129 domain-containing protein [Acidobacteriaceae bacterium]